MKQFKSKLYGEIFQPETFIELIELLKSNYCELEINVKIWRGQSDIDWPITVVLIEG